MIKKKSYCRFCLSFCSLNIIMDEGGSIIKITGDRDDPVSRGYTCEKGRSMHLYYASPERVGYPVVNNKRENWDSALHVVARNIKDSINSFGPDSVALYAGTSAILDAAGMWSALGLMYRLDSHNIYTVSSIDGINKMYVSAQLTGNIFPGLIPQVDYDHTDCIIFIGTNPIISHGHLANNTPPSYHIKKISRSGNVIVFDPRTSETAKLSNLHMKLKPGTDYILLSFLIRELLNLAQGKYCDEHFLTMYKQELKEIHKLVDFATMEYTNTHSGVDDESLYALLSIVKESKKIAAISGVGVTFADSGIVTEWLIWVLVGIKGGLDQKGGIWFNPGYTCRNLQFHPQIPKDIWTGVVPARPELPSRKYERPCAALCDEIIHGNIRTLLVAGGSPLTAFPNSTHTHSALKQISTYVQLDTHNNPNSSLAHVLLPVSGQLERSDSSLYTQNAMNTPGIHYTDAVLSPYKQSKPMWWVFAKLGEYLDIDVLGLGMSVDQLSDLDVLKTIKDGGSLFENDALKENGYIYELDKPYNWVAQHLFDGKWKLITRNLISEFSRIKKTYAEDSRYKLVAFREKNHVNSIFPGKSASPLPVIYLNKNDAQTLGIIPGIKVKVRSKYGIVTGLAVVSDTLMPGTVGVPHGYFGEGNISNITSHLEKVNAASGMPTQTGLDVEVFIN